MFLDRFPSWVLKVFGIVAIALPIICYLTIIAEPAVYRSWLGLGNELCHSMVTGIGALWTCLSIDTMRRIFRLFREMKTCPTTFDGWFALLLFPLGVRDSRHSLHVELPCHLLRVLRCSQSDGTVRSFARDSDRVHAVLFGAVDRRAVSGVVLKARALDANPSCIRGGSIDALVATATVSLKIMGRSNRVAGRICLPAPHDLANGSAPGGSGQLNGKGVNSSIVFLDSIEWRSVMEYYNTIDRPLCLTSSHVGLIVQGDRRDFGK